MTKALRYRCGRHGYYDPDFERVYDGEVCPRIMCLECEEESMRAEPDQRPKEIGYFVDGQLKVVLQEAHLLSAVWKFNPPVVCPTFTFAEDLSPIIPEGALTSEQIMDKMETMLPEIERLAAEGRGTIQ